MTLRAPRTLVYQIFVDRFAGPKGEPLRPVPEGVDPWRHHAGGSLDGIVARLDHIQALGADAIYLTPIFRAPSNHKYDTASFDDVDPAFGGDAAFERLAAACRERALGLILDGVFNHIGEEHPWFRAARADASSKEASYFRFERHPDEYARWRGMGWLPELALDQPAVCDLLFDGEASIMRKWLRRGATGWRLDCANDLGRSICGRATKAAHAEGAPDGVLGEVMNYAEAWIADGVLDGVMNYYFRQSILGMCRGIVPAAQAAYNFKRMARAYRPEALLRSWNMLASHDTPRLATQISDQRARFLAFTLAFAAPGVPLLYYGEEVGMQGGPDPDNRRPMVWDESAWDRETLDRIRKLAASRRQHRALREGAYLPLPQPGHPTLLAFARTTDRPQDAVIVLANASPMRLRAHCFTPYSFLYDGMPMHDLLGLSPPTMMRVGAIDIDLPEWGVVLYAPDDTTIPGYRFFRDR